MWTSIFEFNYWLKQLFDDVWIWDTLLSMIWQHLPSFESAHISSFCIIKKPNAQKLGLYFLIFLLNNFWQRRRMYCSLHRDTITPLRYIVYQWKLGCHPPQQETWLDQGGENTEQKILLNIVKVGTMKNQMRGHEKTFRFHEGHFWSF